MVEIKFKLYKKTERIFFLSATFMYDVRVTCNIRKKIFLLTFSVYAFIGHYFQRIVLTSYSPKTLFIYNNNIKNNNKYRYRNHLY